MKTMARLFILSLPFFAASVAHADTFGSATNQFDITLVPIGNPNNPDDVINASYQIGKVESAYRIGKYEVSEDMINKANALGGLGITHRNLGANKPAEVNWIEAATFVNWLNTSTGHAPAYKFSGSTFELWQPSDAGYNPANAFRNSQAFYFLPSLAEWHKAAYYDPDAGVYYDWPTGSDTRPSSVASGIAANTAVYSSYVSGAGVGTLLTGPADVMLAGGLSPYGTMGQGGNLWEWSETQEGLVNDGSSSRRNVRGAAYHDDIWYSVYMSASYGSSENVLPPIGDYWRRVGFRVASVPEPNAVLLGTLGVAVLLVRKRR